MVSFTLQEHRAGGIVPDSENRRFGLGSTSCDSGRVDHNFCPTGPRDPGKESPFWRFRGVRLRGGVFSGKNCSNKKERGGRPEQICRGNDMDAEVKRAFMLRP